MSDKNKLSAIGKITGRFEATGYAKGDHFGIFGRGIRFVNARGKTLFIVNADDLFDADGNRFEDDLP